MIPHSSKDIVPQQPPSRQELGCGRTVGREGSGSFGMRGAVSGEWGEGADEAWRWQARPSPINDWVSQHQHSQHAV